ncbi:MAG: 3-phosphoshikimate 1-carboxyvinyltransferase [Gammaproteobacteria bacterium]|nr:3-phosphoshikimate 1-carboxyvinyltransferase [Gammaproteobacteria bacterium]
MQYLVLPSELESGTVRVPGDKSISHRALMLGAIAEGTSHIEDFLTGEDCLATLAALRAMGVRIEQVSGTSVSLQGVGMHGLRPPRGVLDLGNSGTAMRLFAGLLSGQKFSATLTGDASLSGRPMKRVITPLTMMGARIESDDGYPPLVVHGRPDLVGINYTLPVASAQVKSALLLAGLYARGETFITEPATTRDHTERMLRAMGATLTAESRRIRMPGQQTLRAADIRVPADLSSAAFPMVAALIARHSEVLLLGVGVNPTRTGVIEILRRMGAEIQLENARMFGEEPVADLRVRASTLRGIDVDPGLVSLAIDEFPILFVAAALAKGVTRFSGLGELRVKESDRIHAMVRGLKALGLTVNETEDGAEIYGGIPAGGHVDSQGDHRVAMAFAVAATRADGPVRIADVANVNTSFPDFAGSLRSLGVDVTEREPGA